MAAAAVVVVVVVIRTAKEWTTSSPFYVFSYVMAVITVARATEPVEVDPQNSRTGLLVNRITE